MNKHTMLFAAAALLLVEQTAGARRDADQCRQIRIGMTEQPTRRVVAVAEAVGL